MPTAFLPNPKMLQKHELASGDLVVVGGELALILMVPHERRSGSSPCTLSLSTFELKGFDDAYACLVSRDFVVAIDPLRPAATDASLAGGEVVIVAGEAEPLFATNSGKSMAFDLAGNGSCVRPGGAAIFPHWTITIADGFGGSREIYAR